MFSFFKKRPESRADSLLKTVSLYAVLAGLLVLVAVGLSFGLWGFMYKPLPLGFFVTGVTVTAAGCAGLMLDDARQYLQKALCRYRRAHAKDKK